MLIGDLTDIRHVCISIIVTVHMHIYWIHAMATCCCLCCNPISADHTRMKKFHGAGCKVAKRVLRDVSCVPQEVYVETRDPLALLCYDCEKTLNNIHNLTAKVKAGVRRKDICTTGHDTIIMGGKDQGLFLTYLDLHPTKQ